MGAKSIDHNGIDTILTGDLGPIRTDSPERPPVSGHRIGRSLKTVMFLQYNGSLMYISIH